MTLLFEPKLSSRDASLLLGELAKYPGVLVALLKIVNYTTDVSKQVKSEEASHFVKKALIWNKDSNRQLDSWSSHFAVVKSACNILKELASDYAKMSDETKAELKAAFGVSDALLADPTVVSLLGEVDSACDSDKRSKLETFARKHGHLLELLDEL